MAVSEIVQNAVEHAQASTISVRPARWNDRIVVHVIDDGVGIDDAQAEGLGLQIVRMLIEEDLRGTVTLERRESGGTSAEISVPGAPAEEP